MFPPSEESPSRLLIKSASIVLAALRSSTYRSVRLVSSLAAALLDGLSEIRRDDDEILYRQHYVTLT